MLLSLQVTAICFSLLGQQRIPAPEIGGLFAPQDAGWAANWQVDVQDHYDLLVAGYDLSPAEQAALAEVLKSRVQHQLVFEKSKAAEIEEIVKRANETGNVEDSPEVLAAGAMIQFMADNMPMNELSVARDMEAKLDSTRAAQGRQRWEELRYRKVQMLQSLDESANYLAGVKGSLIKASTAREAPISPAGNPMPFVPGQGGAAAAQTPGAAGPAAPIEISRKPGTITKSTDPMIQSATSITEKRAAEAAGTGAHRDKAQAELDAKTGTAKSDKMDAKTEIKRDVRPTGKPSVAVSNGKTPEQPTKPINLPPAPELDEWDKYVGATAKKYGFDDGQKIKGQSILKDLRKRAEQYKLSRASEYATVKRMNSMKDRSDRLRDLNRPIDALFDELKQRLDMLATLEQRLKAGAVENKPTGKK